ncbi:hypothetical protein Zm00014a_004852 [Zea mays]|uniref:Uncharacterized protein n=1 Tax=Zea mays TaxID=4577 RepID=A0A3L6D9Y6_MAIZE|nr:hypothetical protein Zm00014a_004852 [Zea mays]
MASRFTCRAPPTEHACGRSRSLRPDWRLFSSVTSVLQAMKLVVFVYDARQLVVFISDSRASSWWFMAKAQFHDQGDVHNIAIECSGGVRT